MDAQFTFHWNKHGYNDTEETIIVQPGNNQHDFTQNPKQYTINLSVWNQTGDTPLTGATAKAPLGNDEFSDQVDANGDATINVARHEPEDMTTLKIDHPEYTNGTLTILNPAYILTDPQSIITYSLTTQGSDSATTELQNLTIVDAIVEALADTFYNNNDFRENLWRTQKMTGGNWIIYNVTTDPSTGQTISQQKVDDQNYAIDSFVNHLVQINGLRYVNAVKIVQPTFPTFTPYIAWIYQNNSAPAGGNGQNPSVGDTLDAFFALTRSGDGVGTVMAEFDGFWAKDLQSNGSNANIYMADSLGNIILNSHGKAVKATYYSYPGGSDFRPDTSNAFYK